MHSVVCTILRRKYIVISTDARWCKSDNDENVNYSYSFGRYLSITFIFSVVVINNAVYTAMAALGRPSTNLRAMHSHTSSAHNINGYNHDVPCPVQKPNCSGMEDVRRRESVY